MEPDLAYCRYLLKKKLLGPYKKSLTLFGKNACPCLKTSYTLE